MGWSLARRISVPLFPAKVRPHPDGELSIEISPEVKGRTIALVGSFYKPVHEHLFEFALMADALVRADVREIVGVVPYIAYARQDRVDAPGVPLSMAVVADMIQSPRMSRLISVELHNPQTADLFTIPLSNLRAETPVTDHLSKSLLNTTTSPLLVSPDKGRAEWVASLGERLKVPTTWLNKQRLSDREVQVQSDESMDGRDVILLDDMIATGGSMARAVHLAREQGADSVHCVAVHGVFAEHAETRLFNAGARSISVSDSIPSGFAVIELADLIAAELAG
jgi:ribose-phosphate pyrophosphokinase